MTDKEITHLANQLDLIKRHYALRNMMGGSYLDFGLDLEFKLQGSKRELYIKQVRLYRD
jgi:pyruvate, water dikinase